jgi:hypothetical protein
MPAKATNFSRSIFPNFPMTLQTTIPLVCRIIRFHGIFPLFDANEAGSYVGFGVFKRGDASEEMVLHIKLTAFAASCTGNSQTQLLLGRA